MAEAEINDGGS